MLFDTVNPDNAVPGIPRNWDEFILAARALKAVGLGLSIEPRTAECDPVRQTVDVPVGQGTICLLTCRMDVDPGYMAALAYDGCC